MRVGIPHRGGRLAIHAFDCGYAAMVSASAFWNSRSSRFMTPSVTPLSELDFALDSAGFSAMRLWKARGPQRGMAGIFPWTYAQYIELAALSGCAWWSQPDLCCEPEIAADRGEVDWRIHATATLLEGTLRIVQQWQGELARDCSGDVAAALVRPPVPVLQGWRPDDYLRSLELTLEVWERWQPWLAAPTLIGVGSVCRRSLADRDSGLLSVLGALEGRLPEGARLHLFGIKGAALRHVRTMPWVASADSMAFDLGARRAAHELQRSNSFEHRSHEMSRWMTDTLKRARPARGDQMRLPIRF